MAAVARQTKETGLTGEESYLRLLKSPVRTGRLLSMWLQSAEYVRQGWNRVRKPKGQRKRKLEPGLWRKRPARIRVVAMMATMRLTTTMTTNWMIGNWQSGSRIVVPCRFVIAYS
jgi:hypothetical protein